MMAARAPIGPVLGEKSAAMSSLSRDQPDVVSRRGILTRDAPRSRRAKLPGNEERQDTWVPLSSRRSSFAIAFRLARTDHLRA